MNRRQKKEWLKEAWNLQRTVDFCNEQLKDASIYSSPEFGERVVTSKGNSEELKVARKLAEVERIRKDRDKAEQQLAKRRLAINNLKDGDQKKVLWLRYISHYGWDDVCLSMNCSRATCNRIHDAGVDKIRTM